MPDRIRTGTHTLTLPISLAVAVAVRAATDAVIRDLPLSPEDVWRALRARE
jgi:CO/xanthine dehydrogenase Mo-binding subunit